MDHQNVSIFDFRKMAVSETSLAAVNCCLARD